MTLALWRREQSSQGQSGGQPVFLRARSSKWYIVATASISIFTDVFLYGMIVPIIPFALESRANVNAANVQHWVSILLAVYSASLLLGSPWMGWIADRVDTRRSPLIAGLFLLTGSTLMLMLGRSLELFLLGRVIQGFSAAVVWVASLALLVDTVGQKDIGRTMGIVSLVYSAGVLLAPLIGGIVYARAGYYAVFYIAFGLFALDAFLRLTFIEKKSLRRWLPDEAVDLGPDSLRTRDGSIEVDNIRDPSDHRQARRKPPLLYLATSRRMLSAFWGILVISALMTAFDTTLPLFANRVFGYDPLGSGLLFLALLLPNALGPYIGSISDKHGPRWLAVAGFILALPFFVLLRLVNQKTVGQVVLLCALLACIGFSIALPMVSLMSEFSTICESKQRHHPGLFGHRGAYAQSYGIFNMAWASGALVGPIWAAYVSERDGWATMTWSLGLLSVVSAVPVAVWTGGRAGGIGSAARREG